MAQELKKQQKIAMVIGSLLPVIYVWSLPLLEKWGYAYDQLTNAHIAPENIDEYSYTVSSYITSP